ncbi:MAG: 23S rRNA (pseudouridine(1915)-N(3))-methyltransferase RlmH [Methanoregulaceae archaeon]
MAIGKIKDRFVADGINEYAKRLRPYTKLGIVEFPEEHIPDRASAGETERIKDKEGELILRTLRDSDLVLALDPRGISWSSEELAQKLNFWEVAGISRLVFIIGGPLGLADGVRKRADSILSLSKMTFTHPMARLILLEQVYRAFRINRGEPYHK